MHFSTLLHTIALFGLVQGKIIMHKQVQSHADHVKRGFPASPFPSNDNEADETMKRAEDVVLILGDIPLLNKIPKAFNTASSLKADAGYNELAAVATAMIDAEPA